MDEKILLGALRTIQLKLTDIEILFKLIADHPEKSKFINLQIELFENHKNYIEAFKCLLQSKSQ